MNKTLFFSIITMAGIICSCGHKQKSQETSSDEITVACYYFPNYHTGDPRNEVHKGKGWSEWELVKTAKPRFAGHHQPIIPAWGYTDEKNPKEMARKIQVATEHGINAFIFDWYMYEDGPFLNRCIDEGFLQADNRNRIKFGLMWANHDWADGHPYKKGVEAKMLYPGVVSPKRYEEICDHLIEKYFKQPNYWLVDGKAYFSVYHIKNFVQCFGSVEATRQAMNVMREKAIKAGLKGVHWNIVIWGNPILPVDDVQPANTSEMISALGFDSFTSYVWLQHASLPEQQTDYNSVKNQYFKYWDEADKYSLPYHPNVTMGWDVTPRCDPDAKWELGTYPYTNIIGNNTPENFKWALQQSKERILANPHSPRIISINCWNEWTEGSYLEPDTRNGMGYLEAVKAVFGN